MKQVPQHQRFTLIWRWNCSTDFAALVDGLLAVTRARERGEPYWALDVRRAQARIAAQRARHRAVQTIGPSE